MSKLNYSAIEELVSVKYGDLKGIVKIDMHDNVISIYELCKDNNLETEDIFIVGFGLEANSLSGIGKKDQIACRILYLKKSEHGEGFDEIQSLIKKSGELKAKQKTFYLNYADIGKYIKRFDFLALTKIGNDIDSIKIEDEEE